MDALPDGAASFQATPRHPLLPSLFRMPVRVRMLLNTQSGVCWHMPELSCLGRTEPVRLMPANPVHASFSLTSFRAEFRERPYPGGRRGLSRGRGPRRRSYHRIDQPVFCRYCPHGRQWPVRVFVSGSNRASRSPAGSRTPGCAPPRIPRRKDDLPHRPPWRRGTPGSRPPGPVHRSRVR